jgi:hypothetical protein
VALAAAPVTTKADPAIDIATDAARVMIALRTRFFSMMCSLAVLLV